MSFHNVGMASPLFNMVQFHSFWLKLLGKANNLESVLTFPNVSFRFLELA